MKTRSQTKLAREKLASLKRGTWARFIGKGDKEEEAPKLVPDMIGRIVDVDRFEDDDPPHVVFASGSCLFCVSMHDLIRIENP